VSIVPVEVRALLSKEDVRVAIAALALDEGQSAAGEVFFEYAFVQAQSVFVQHPNVGRTGVEVEVVEVVEVVDGDHSPSKEWRAGRAGAGEVEGPRWVAVLWRLCSWRCRSRCDAPEGVIAIQEWRSGARAALVVSTSQRASL
jgi:hypothetical protein